MAGNVRSGVRLTPAQLRVIRSRCSGMTWTDAARDARVSDRTVRRWRTEPGFVAALRDAQARAFDDGLGLIKANVEKAAQVISLILDAGDDAAVRLRAATVTIEAGIKAVEVLDVVRRLEVLEQLVGARPGRAA